MRFRSFQPIDVDEVRIKLLSMSDEPLWLRSEATHLAPGRNEIQVSALVCVVQNSMSDESLTAFSA